MNWTLLEPVQVKGGLHPLPVGMAGLMKISPHSDLDPIECTHGYNSDSLSELLHWCIQ